MKPIQNLCKASEYKSDSTESQDLISNEINNAKWQQASTMPNNDAKNQIEQQYYNKASGCSVKAQKDNLFDYPSRSK